MTSTATPAPQVNAVASLFVGLGNTSGYETQVLNLDDEGLATGNTNFEIDVYIAVSQTDQALNLANYCDNLLSLCIQDITTGNVDSALYAFASGLSSNAKTKLGVGGTSVMHRMNIAPPTLYFTSNTTDILRLRVTGIGTRN